MKKYLIKKIVFANSLDELLTLERGGEIVETTLQDDILDSGQIGFMKQDDRKRD